jgi:hypothetical protein
MASDLHPMSIGDVFDTAFDLYKHNFALFAGVTAIVHVPAQVAFAAGYLAIDFDRFDRATRTSADVGAMFVALGFLFLLFVGYHFLYVAHSGALSIAVSERLLGRPITIGESYRRLRPTLAKLLFTWVLIDLILLVCTFAIFIAFAVIGSFVIGAAALAAGQSGEPGAVILTVAVILMFVLPFLAFIAMAICFAVFSTQVVVLEGNGYSGALSRNWSLLRGRFWQPFWFTVLLTVLVFGLHIALQESVEFLLGLSLYSWMPLSHLSHQVIEEVLATVISLLLQPFMMIALTVLYFDQRMRREGFDIELALYEREAALARAALPSGESTAATEGAG